MATRVYEFGALQPTTNLDLVREQMSRAHRYRNTLVEIEHKRRAKAREALAKHPDIEPKEQEITTKVAELKDVRAQIRAHRAKTRKRATPADLGAKAKELSAELKTLRAEVRAAKKAVAEDDEVQAAFDAANDAASEAVKAARAASGLYWGTYLICEQAIDAAKRERRDPRFHRWDGSGRVAVQLQKGRDTALLHEYDSRFWIQPVSPLAFVKGTPSRRMLMRTHAHIRIGSDDSKKPIWTVVPIVMHRPLDPGRIKWVRLLRDRIADREVWKVQITVDLEDARSPYDQHGSGTAAIDIGWRKRPNGDLRVAVLCDDQGNVEELRLPSRLLSKDKHVAGLQSLRDRLFDSSKQRVIPWLAQDGGSKITELNPAHVALWRNPGRLVALLRDFGSRMPEDLKSELDAWRKQDRHLWLWAEHERKKVRRQRREMYRLWAVKVTRTYAHVVIEDFDLRVFAKAAAPEDGAATEDTQLRHQRAFAAISSLREALKQAAIKRGCVLTKADPRHTTQKCSECGQTNKVEEELLHTCDRCGRTWDQDENAARNLLASAVAERNSEGTLATPNCPENDQLSERQRRFRRQQHAIEERRSNTG